MKRRTMCNPEQRKLLVAMIEEEIKECKRDQEAKIERIKTLKTILEDLQVLWKENDDER